MNILVTGANGLVGTNLIKRLSKKHFVYALGRSKNEFQELVNVKYIEKELCHMDFTSIPGDVDVIYYLAQSRRFREFPCGILDVFEVNVSSPIKFADWAVSRNVRKFFYASTGGVYKNPTQPVREFFDINANEKNSFYFDSKLCSEILLKNFSLFFETFAILRPFFIYGPGQNEDMFLPRLIKSVFTGGEIFLNGVEGIRVNPIYVDDASVAFENLLEIEKGEYIFNIAGNEVVSIKELSSIIGNVVGKEPFYKYIGSTGFDLIADISFMKEKLHVPQICLLEGIQRTFDAMRVKSKTNFHAGHT